MTPEQHKTYKELLQNEDLTSLQQTEWNAILQQAHSGPSLTAPTYPRTKRKVAAGLNEKMDTLKTNAARGIPDKVTNSGTQIQPRP